MTDLDFNMSIELKPTKLYEYHKELKHPISFNFLWDETPFTYLRMKDFEGKRYLEYKLKCNPLARDFDRYNVETKFIVSPDSTQTELENFYNAALENYPDIFAKYETSWALIENYLNVSDLPEEERKNYHHQQFVESIWHLSYGPFFWYEEHGGCDPEDIFPDIPEGWWVIDNIHAVWHKDYYGEVDADYYFDDYRPATIEEIASAYGVDFWETD